MAANDTSHPGRPDWVPDDACTLPSSERPLRVAEFDDLFAQSTRAVERLSPTRIRVSLDSAAEQRARDLARRETQCCSFFVFDFASTDTALLLEIAVPPGRSDVLAALAARIGE